MRKTRRSAEIERAIEHGFIAANLDTAKKNKRKRQEPKDFHPRAGMLKVDIRKRGLEVQVYAYSSGIIVWAGPHYVPEISLRVIYQLEMHWRRWRHWYDNLPANARRSYPAKEGARAADCLVVFPVDDPSIRATYRLT